ncbi:MAG TPA: ThuA domain-containing protein [Acidimicrobiales bacterium]|nr:ThuA domain-containing protein [Acidimicrobiales bacterium]
MTGLPKLVYVTQVAPYHHGPAGVHGVLEQSATALAELARMAGLEPLHARDVAGLEAAELSRDTAVLALFTIGETPWSPDQRRAILDGLGSGRLGVVSIHSATDSCYGWEDYASVVGARFNGHPWTQEVDLEVVEPAHPATSHLPGTWRWHDEIYQFRQLRPDARVLLRVPEHQLDLTAEGAEPPPFGFPMAWCFTEGRGRVFATTLGHFPAAWESPRYLRHLSGGLAWVLGEGA